VILAFSYNLKKMIGRLLGTTLKKQPLCCKFHLILAINRSFSLLTDYKERRDKKLLGTHLIPDTPTYHVTPTRPGNFGEHLDFKINIDNWFEENR
jgi:hypothetical protein